MSYTPRLKKKYTEEIVPMLFKKFGYKNIMQMPEASKNYHEYGRWRSRSG